MGLQFKKRDDFGKVMEDLGISNVDIILDDSIKTDKPEDPFAKFLKTETDEKTSETK
jgi:hypothetical protein